MTNLLNDCVWPDLKPPYDQALRESVAYILTHFEVVGIIAAGSIIRGTPHAGSDFDIVVINARSQRQRIQKFFQGVPTEIFLNPVQSIQGYFQSECERGRPGTAHMLTTGFTVLALDDTVAQLCQQARTWLERAWEPTPAALTALRYGIADRYENACDIIETDPWGASLLLNLVVFDMLQYTFAKAGHYLPREKDLLTATARLNPPLAQLARQFLSSPNPNDRQKLAAQLADLTIEAQGFFEWTSPLEEVE